MKIEVCVVVFVIVFVFVVFVQMLVGGNMGKNVFLLFLMMKDLLLQGYEIKVLVLNGDKFVVFMQKDQLVYVCEFVFVMNMKCGVIN